MCSDQTTSGRISISFAVTKSMSATNWEVLDWIGFESHCQISMQCLWYLSMLVRAASGVLIE